MSWEWLCTPPHQVTLDRGALAGLSDRPLPLDEVRARLLDRGCPLPVRDAVWSHLITRARLDGPTWTVVCAGMALPMLATVCRTLCGGPSRRGRYGADVDDVASGIVTGFLDGLAQVDLHRPGLATSLRWAAVRGGHVVLREQRRAPHPLSHDWLVRAVLTPSAGVPCTGAVAGHPAHADGGRNRGNVTDADSGRDERGHGLAPAGRWESTPPPVNGGHPDLVLAAAVADGVLTAAEAALIGETRLEATTLAQAAARRGRTVGAVTMQRLRAEMRLVDHLRTSYYRDTDTDTDDTGHGDTGRTAVAPGRIRQRRTRTVTGHRSRAAGPRTPTCHRPPSPPVHTRPTTPPRLDDTPGPSEPGHGGDEHGGDEQVTR